MRIVSYKTYKIVGRLCDAVALPYGIRYGSGQEVEEIIAAGNFENGLRDGKHDLEGTYGVMIDIVSFAELGEIKMGVPGE